MNIDPGQVGQLLNMLPYPISKNDLVQKAQQIGINDQMMGVINRLPDKTYNSSQDLQSDLGGMMKNMGGFKMP